MDLFVDSRDLAVKNIPHPFSIVSGLLSTDTLRSVSVFVLVDFCSHLCFGPVELKGFQMNPLSAPIFTPMPIGVMLTVRKKYDKSTY